MEFKDYLEARAAVRGAFGKQVPHSRFTNAFMGLDNRVAFGKSIEPKVIKALADNCGKIIKPSNEQRDKYDKIDGWLQEDGVFHPVQIKYRDSGDDIPFEVVKDFKNNVPGRDMIGRATLYICLNMAGDLIRIRKTEEIKTVVKAMTETLKAQVAVNPSNRTVTTQHGQVKITRDPRTNAEKIMAFIKPDSLTWKSDCKLNKSIWS